MRAEPLLALLLLAAPALRAGDLGQEVTFGSQGGARFQVSAGGASRVVFDSGPSDAPRGAWDTVLIQGEMPDPAVRFEAARLGAGWIDLKVKRFPNGRFWAKARVPRGIGALRLRATSDGSAVAHEVVLYGAEVFNDVPEVSTAPVVPPRGPVDPAAVPPSIHARASWGAAPPTGPYEADHMPWRVTLHHTAVRYPATLEESVAEARFLQDLHQNGRKWIDIGYHYLVDPAGNILEGRPLETLGAHTLNNNPGNVGIALLGFYHPPADDKPTAAQLAAVEQLGRFLVRRFGIGPAVLKGHRDYKETECPGDLVYPRLDELRRGLAVPPAPALLAPDWNGLASDQ